MQNRINSDFKKTVDLESSRHKRGEEAVKLRKKQHDDVLKTKRREFDSDVGTTYNLVPNDVKLDREYKDICADIQRDCDNVKSIINLMVVSEIQLPPETNKSLMIATAFRLLIQKLYDFQKASEIYYDWALAALFESGILSEIEICIKGSHVELAAIGMTIITMLTENENLSHSVSLAACNSRLIDFILNWCSYPLLQVRYDALKCLGSICIDSSHTRDVVIESGLMGALESQFALEATQSSEELREKAAFAFSSIFYSTPLPPLERMRDLIKPIFLLFENYQHETCVLLYAVIAMYYVVSSPDMNYARYVCESITDDMLKKMVDLTIPTDHRNSDQIFIRHYMLEILLVMADMHTGYARWIYSTGGFLNKLNVLLSNHNPSIIRTVFSILSTCATKGEAFIIANIESGVYTNMFATPTALQSSVKFSMAEFVCTTFMSPGITFATVKCLLSETTALKAVSTQLGGNTITDVAQCLQCMQCVETIMMHGANNGQLKEMLEFIEKEGIVAKLQKIDSEVKTGILSDMSNSLLSRFFEKDDTLNNDDDTADVTDVVSFLNKNDLFRELTASYRLERQHNPNADINME